MPSVTLKGEARDVALGEAQAVLAMVQDDVRRGRLAGLVAAIGEGEVADEEAAALEELLELALQTGRVRALYGPGGESAVLKVYRSLPRGRGLARSAGEVTDALAALKGQTLDSVAIQAVGPGAYVLSIHAGDLELAVRLDRQGARLASLGV